MEVSKEYIDLLKKLIRVQEFGLGCIWQMLPLDTREEIFVHEVRLKAYEVSNEIVKYEVENGL